MGFISRMAGTALLIGGMVGVYQYLKVHYAAPTLDLPPGITSLVAAESERLRRDGAEHFSPGENLERFELAQLREAAARARQSHRPLDIAMYAFTDRVIADLLISEADRGTTIRIYRDGEQYEHEESNAARFRDQSTTGMFRGHHNVHVRVKPPSRSDLMHLKAWSDGTTLREGSANWSPAALKRQDNNVRITGDASEVKAFEGVFEVMWTRTANTVVQ